MRKRNPFLAQPTEPPADQAVAVMVFNILRGAAAFVPCGVMGGHIVFASYMDREYFFAALNDFVLVTG